MIFLAAASLFYANETQGYCDKLCQSQKHTYGTYSFSKAQCTCTYDATIKGFNETEITGNFINMTASSGNYVSET